MEFETLSMNKILIGTFGKWTVKFFSFVPHFLHDCGTQWKTTLKYCIKTGT